MDFSLFFYLFVPFLVLTDAKCTPQSCGCRSACRSCGSPPPCAPVVPIMLDDCGPNPSPLPPINAPPLCSPLVNRPPVALPVNVPPTKTLGNTCHCVKTVIKPQVVQQLITVPSIQRYIQTTHTPVVEHIHYHGVPINCPPYTPDSPAPAAAAAPCSCAAKAAAAAATAKLAAAAATAKMAAAPCSCQKSLTPCLTFAAAKPPAPAPPASATVSLLALLSALAAARPPAATPPALPPCPPALPPCAPALPPCSPALPSCFSALPSCPPALPPCAPALPPCPVCPPAAPPALPPCSPTSACISVPPALLSLLSKLT